MSGPLRFQSRMIALAIFFFSISILQASDLTTSDGHVYRNFEITHIDPDAMRITHEDGAARIPYEKLPSALQKKYFDPVKAQAYRQEAEAAQAAAQAKAMEAEKAQQAAAEEAARQVRAEERRQAERIANERQAKKDKIEDESKARNATEAARHHRKLAEAGIGGLIGLFFYFIPTIAGFRKTNALAIFILNFFLGWTLVGWVIAFVWAATKDSVLEEMARERMRVQSLPQPPGPPHQLPSRPGHYLE